MRIVKKLALLLIPLTGISMLSFSQAVHRSVTEKYDASVVARLFSITKYVDVDKDIQLQMAESIRLHDSTIASWIMIGKTKESIDTLQQVAQFQLYGMLSKEQLQAYKYKSNFEISSAIANGEAEYVKSIYQPDSATYVDLKKSLTNKYNYILQAFSDNYIMNHEAASQQLKKVEGIYDEYKYFPVLYARKYIGEYVSTIGKIKPIPKATLEQIEHSFYNLIWQNKYSDWSAAAENATRIHLPDTAIFSTLHRPELDQLSYEAFAAEKYDMIFREHVSEDAFKKLDKMLKEKYYNRFLLGRTYAAFYPRVYDSLVKQMANRYDSTITATMIYDGSLQPTTQFAIALKFKDFLKLSKATCDELVYHAMYLEKVRDSIVFRDPFASIDFGEYETTHLSRILTEQQYNVVLFHKNRTYAAANAVTDWQEMVARGLDKGFYRDETIQQLTDFYISKNGAWCRYANDKITLWANLYALDQVKPKALKVLDPVRWSGTTHRSNNNLQLQW